MILRTPLSPLRNRDGLSLAELMIAVALISIGVIASIATFQYISRSTQHSKSRTLAANLAQEQVEKLKNLTYYTLLVTTSVYNDTRFDPAIGYDTGNYPPQTLIEGGISFTRTTRVDFAYQSGSTISTAPWTTDDTALKCITVDVLWFEDQTWKSLEVQNLLANPAARPMDATASGRVRDGLGAAIPGALVQVIDNPNWYGYANATGDYRFSIGQGSYTLQASSVGYYTSTTNGYLSFTSGATTTRDFTLTAISSGTLVGMVFLNNHLLVSQVVASTDDANGSEYIELYNPTTAAINIGSGGVPVLNLYVFDRTDNTVPTAPMVPVSLVYVSTFIPSGGYYLIGNTTTIHAAGMTILTDAQYSTIMAPTHLIPQGEAGGLGMADLTPDRIDSLAWSKTASGHSCPDTPNEGTCIGLASGIQPDQQLVRMTSPGIANSSHGNAYDSENNDLNFIVNSGLTTPPRNSATTRAPISGTPATGAVVLGNDMLMEPASCNTTTLSSGHEVCTFALHLSTGTWTVDVTLNGYYAQIQNVTPTAGATLNLPNASTVPTWTSVANSSTTLLRNTTDYAFVTGYVYSGTGGPLSGIKVTDGNGRTATSLANGAYTLTATPGLIQLTANPADATVNRGYVTQSLAAQTLVAGSLYPGQDFYLSRGGVIRGYFQTSSATPLPGRVAVATQSSLEKAQAASDQTGYFYLQNLATGTYTVTPALDTMESATPASLTVVLNSTGTTATVSTFTITTGIAEITGQLTLSGQPIKTGVLVIASSTTISSTLPPAQVGSTGAACNPCYYTASSNAQGEYSLYVRNSATAYKVYGWYTSFSGETPSITKKGPYSVTVSSAGAIASQNISWP